MSIIISEVYDAFIAAGTPEEKAKKAAEAMANYEARFNKIDLQLHLLKWMVGFNLAFTMAIVYKLFFVQFFVVPTQTRLWKDSCNSPQRYRVTKNFRIKRPKR